MPARLRRHVQRRVMGTMRWRVRPARRHVQRGRTVLSPVRHHLVRRVRRDVQHQARELSTMQPQTRLVQQPVAMQVVYIRGQAQVGLRIRLRICVLCQNVMRIRITQQRPAVGTRIHVHRVVQIHPRRRVIRQQHVRVQPVIPQMAVWMAHRPAHLGAV